MRENKTALLVIRMWSSMETKTIVSNGTLIGPHTKWLPVNPKVNHCCRMTSNASFGIFSAFHQCPRQPCPILSSPWSQSGVGCYSQVLLRTMHQDPDPWKPLHIHPYWDFQVLAQSVVSHVQFSTVAQSCPTLCDPMDRSTPGLPVHHQLPEFTQTHAHRVGDAIQPSHPLSSPSPPAPNPS